MLASDVFVTSDDVPGSYARTVATGVVTYSPLADTAQIGDFRIRADLTAGLNVIVNTINPGGGSQGNLILSQADLALSPAADASLDLRADNDLIFQNSQISASNSLLTVILNSDRDGSGAGRVEIDLGSTVNSNGADITIGGGADPASTPARGTTLEPDGVSVFGSLMAGAGNISIRGQGLSDGSDSSDADGIVLEGTIDTTSGNISLVGIGGNTMGSGNEGIVLDFGVIGSNSGDLSISGVGGGNGSASNGVTLANSGLISVTNGRIAVSGVGAASGTGAGVALSANDDVIESLGSGSIHIDAIGSGGSAGLQISGEIGGVTAAGDITLVSDTFELIGGLAFIEGRGNLVIRPMDPATSIGIGGGLGTLDVSDSELAQISDGFASITIGDASAGSGAVAVDSATLRDPVVIVGGSISVDNGISGSGGITLTARDDNSLGQDIAINSGVISDASGNVTFNVADDLLLAAVATVVTTNPLASVSVNVDQAVGEVIGSRLFLDGSLSSSQVTIAASDPTPPHQIVIGSGPSQLGVSMSSADSGQLSIDTQTIAYVGIREIDVPVAPSVVVITSDATDETLAVSQSGNVLSLAVDQGQMITFNEPTSSLTVNTGGGTDVVNVASLNVAFSDALFIGDGDSSVDDTVNVDGTVTTTAGGLEIDALHINVNADLDIGDALVLGNPVSSGLISIATANIRSVGIQQLLDAVLLSSNTTLASSAGPILLTAEVDGAHALVIDAASIVDLGGEVGAVTPLGSLLVNSVNDRIGIGANITTIGFQEFDAAVEVLGVSSLSLISTSDSVTFNSSIDDSSPDATDLTIRSAGVSEFVGDVGMTSRLRSLELSTAGPFATPGNIRVLNDLAVTVADTGASGDDLVVRGRVQSASGNVFFRAGDSVEVETGATVSAAQGSIAIETDAEVTDPDATVGGVVSLNGLLTSGTGALLSGGIDADQFFVSRQPGSSVTITGNDPLVSPGDVVNLDAAGETVTLDAGSGSFVIGAAPPVTTSGVEKIRLSNASTLTILGSNVADDVVIAADPNQSGDDLLGINGGLSIAINLVSAIVYDGGGGDDRLTFDATGGLPTTPVTFNGQGQSGAAGGDRLTVVGTFGRQTLDYDAPGTDGNRGSIQLDGAVITYTGLEPIDAGDSDDTILNLSTGLPNNAILRGGTAADTVELVDNGSTFESTVIPNPVNRLTINLGDQGDGLQLTALNAAFAASIIIRGGAGTDDVSVDGVTLDATGGRALDVAGVENLAVVNSTFSNRIADFGAGLLVVGGTTRISNSTFQFNSATGGDAAQGGGAIFTNSDMTIENNTLIDGNTAFGAQGNGGGILVGPSGTLTVMNSTISNNEASNVGGGIAVRAGGGSVTLLQVNVSDNTANESGGGLMAVGATVTVTGSEIFGNLAKGVTTADGIGGGLLVTGGGNLVVDSSTIASNTASVGGGGIAVRESGLDLENVTMAFNEASSRGGGIDYQNGNDAVSQSIRFSTITSNVSLGGGSNLAATGFPIDVTGTIFNDGDCLFVNSGLNSLGGNLDSGVSCGLNPPNDLISTDPLLGSLQDNGGDVRTIALRASSPAIDAGPITGPDVDARGAIRPIDGDADGTSLFDIGAFEAPQISQLVVSDVTVNEDAVTATVTVTFFGFSANGLSVDYATTSIAPTTSPDDYADTSGTLTFSGTDGENQSFTVDIVNDDIVEPTETILVALSNASDASVDLSSTGLITLIDDDFGTITVSDVAVGEGDGAAIVTVTVDKPVQGGFSVDFATSDGTATEPDDYSAANGTLDFLGDGGESRTFSVSINDDTDLEPTELLTVLLSSPSVSQLDATDTATITITDNDVANPSIIGHVYCDANNNRMEEPGEEAPDMQVFLDSNGNGELDSGERVTLTDSGGDYRFDDVLTPSANVTVQVIPDCNTVTEEPLITRMTVDVGDLASSIVSADIDGDSDRDLLVTGDLSGTLTVLENNGGVFTQRSVIAVPERPQSVFAFEPSVGPAVYAVAAIGTGGSPGEVFLWDRSSLLSGVTPAGLPAGNGPVDVLIDDFDQDGLPDVVAGSFRSSDLTLRMSQSGEVTTLVSDAGQVFSIASGNLNELGTAPELIVAGVGYSGSSGIGRIEVFSMNSDGVMAKTVSVSSAATISVLADDVTGDGLDEVLALSGAGTLTVYRFNGDSIVETLVTDITAGATSLAIGDFNDDGKKDVAVANQAGQSIEVLVGGGDGRFVHVTTIGDIATPTDLVVDDFNGDGYGDIAVTNFVSDLNPNNSGAPQLTLPSSVTILLMDIATRNVVVTSTTVANFELPTADPAILLDVNSDNRVSALDALLVINALGRLSSAEGESPVELTRAATDVNGDGRTSALDALMIINRLSAIDRGEAISQQFVETLDGDDDDDELTAAIDWVHRANLEL